MLYTASLKQHNKPKERNEQSNKVLGKALRIG
jgi:hypothetical protein